MKPLPALHAQRCPCRKCAPGRARNRQSTFVLGLLAGLMMLVAATSFAAEPSIIDLTIGEQS